MKEYDISLEKHFDLLSSDPAESSTLPGFFYHQQNVFEAEKEKIFYKKWHLVAHISQLESPGQFVCAQILDENIFVIRGQDGIIRGFYNVCQHRAHELLEGQGSVRSAIVCPYHNWTYNTQGELSGVTYCSKQQDLNKADYSLVSIQVEENLGFIFVNLDLTAPPLTSLVGDMFEDMRANIPWIGEMIALPEINDRASQVAPRIDTNWKVFVENNMENYHVAPVHPTYTDMIDVESYSWEIRDMWVKGSARLKNRENVPYNIDPSAPYQKTFSWRIWPNIAFNIFPGQPIVTALSILPVTPNITTTHRIVISRPGDEGLASQMDYRFNVLWPEDKRSIESAHRGLKSKGYRQGRFIINPDIPGIGEQGTHFFAMRYLEEMGIKALKTSSKPSE